MIRFCEVGSPLIEIILEVRRLPGGVINHKQLFPQIECKFDDKLLKFCFPNKEKSGSEKFVFAAKYNDSEYKYGYVIQERGTAYCVFSSFYDELRVMKMLEVYIPKYKARDYAGANSIAQHYLTPNIHGDTSLLAEITIASLINDMLKLVDPQSVGILIAYIALDERVIVTSNSLEKISHFCFSLISLIHPLNWPGVFIPLIPFFIIDTLLAPFPYIVGIHSSLMQEVKEDDLESHIMLGIDTQSLTYSGSMELPEMVHHLINKFAREVNNNTNPLDIGKICRHLFVSIVAYGLGTGADKPFKMLKHWNAAKEIIPEEGDFCSAIVASQTVLTLMRAIEQAENGVSNEVFSTYWPNVKVISTPQTPSRFNSRSKTSIITLPSVILSDSDDSSSYISDPFNRIKLYSMQNKSSPDVVHKGVKDKQDIKKDKNKRPAYSTVIGDKPKIINDKKDATFQASTFQERLNFYRQLEKK